MNSILCRFLSLVILACCGAYAVAQTPDPIASCAVGVRAPAIGFWTWAANAHVKVYIRASDFTAEETPFLLTPLQNWDAAYEASGSGVRFEYQGATPEPVLCDNCLTIMRGKVFDRSRRHATELRAYSARRDQVITYASIVIDPTLTNLKAITNAIAHELGHNFGLLDCYTCKQKSTVMNQLKTMNVPNGMEAPTTCDLAQVKEAYRELKAHPRPSPLALTASSIPVDDGEEPVDDDTPVVTQKPRRP